MKKLIIVSIALLLCPMLSFGQTNTITLVASGDGTSKTEAESMALRSAIEQAFGTFVSANTTIMNDELVKEEIATISSGNIEHYEIVNESIVGGKWNVTLKAVVSINKLIEYAQSHGSSTEFAGQNFAMQVKMRKLNKENEEKVLSDILEKVEWVSSNVSLYDYEIEQGEPQFASNSSYKVPIKVSAYWNDNAFTIQQMLKTTFESLALSISDQDSYALNNYPMTPIRPLEMLFGDKARYWMRSDDEFLDQIVLRIKEIILLNLHSFTIARDGGGSLYKEIRVPNSNTDENINEKTVFSLILELPENELFETKGFSVKPCLKLNSMNATENGGTKLNLSDNKHNEFEEAVIKFELTEEKPKFRGGDASAFNQWVESRVLSLDVGAKGRVFIQFTIDTDGTVYNVKVLRGVNPELDKEAVRVISSSPQWQPGKQRGKPVKVLYTTSVIFK